MKVFKLGANVQPISQPIARSCDQKRIGRRPKRRISMTAKMPPHPVRHVNNRIEQTWKPCSRTKKEDTPAESLTVGKYDERNNRNRTHLEVRLLITPVVVSYCSASAKMSAIPTMHVLDDGLEY